MYTEGAKQHKSFRITYFLNCFGDAEYIFYVSNRMIFRMCRSFAIYSESGKRVYSQLAEISGWFVWKITK